MLTVIVCKLNGASDTVRNHFKLNIFATNSILSDKRSASTVPLPTDRLFGDLLWLMTI